MKYLNKVNVALPESQMDRFMVRLSIGYPSTDEQIRILRARRYTNPLDEIKTVASAESIVEVQNYLSTVKMNDDVLYYLIKLCEVTREMPMVELGISPRGVMALSQMAKAKAVLDDRGYVVPEDIQYVFEDVCEHRLILKPQARVEGVTGREILMQALEQVKPAKR